MGPPSGLEDLRQLPSSPVGRNVTEPVLHQFYPLDFIQIQIKCKKFIILEMTGGLLVFENINVRKLEKKNNHPPQYNL